MSYVIIAFLWASLLVYLLTGGADYGAGILEWFTPEYKRELIRSSAYKAIGPVWEANHMWLIIAVVIMFVGFPQIFYYVSIYLHIPLVLMLLGIIARGTAFSFRNYDAVKDKYQSLYNRIYIYSSVITPFFLGVIAGSAVSGQIDPTAKDFSEAYIYDWFNFFSISVGIFAVFLCGFNAAVYLSAGFEQTAAKNIFAWKVNLMTFLLIISMALVFVSSVHQHIPLTNWLCGNKLSGILSFGALLFFISTLLVSRTPKPLITRLLTGAMVTLLWLAVTYAHFPNIVMLKNGSGLSLLDSQVPDKTKAILATCLLGGSLFIIPSLFYLLYSFGKKTTENDFRSGE